MSESFPIGSRYSWAGSARPSRGLTRDPQRKTEAFVHYTVTKGRRPWTVESARAHMRLLYDIHVRSNGWADIGYHFVVFQPFWRLRPLIFAARPLWAIPSAQYRHNSGTVAAVVVATTGEPFLGRTEDAVAWLFDRFRYVGPVGGHRDVVSTSCPGARIYRRVPTIADKAGLRTYKPRSSYRA